MEGFVEAFVEKLILLEETAGASVPYRAMPPISHGLQDYVAIQDVGRRIAGFVGLADLRFIVAFAAQEKGVGGSVDLSEGDKEVFVEVDPKLMGFPDAVAATLCHEACHKWLQTHGLRGTTDMDSEILTDITAVFLGLGKIMLNGYKTERTTRDTTAHGTREFTESLSVGYLDRPQLAFVYRLVCGMRRVPALEATEGLNAEAISAIEASDRAWGDCYDSRFHQAGASEDAVADFERRLIAPQIALAELDKHLCCARTSFCETVEALIAAKHEQLQSIRRKVVEATGISEVDPVLRFLRAIRAQFEVARAGEQVPSVLEAVRAYLDQARLIWRHLSRNQGLFPPVPPAAFGIVRCPIDGTKMRLPENSADIIVSCPTCKYRFAYNTREITRTQVAPFATRIGSRVSGLWRVVRDRMSRRR